MTDDNIPAYVDRLLGRLSECRPTRNGWVAKCPCPDHNASSSHPGDQNPSLNIGLGDQGRILIQCCVGCKTEAVLDAVGLHWRDLFAPDGQGEAEPSNREVHAPSAASIEVRHAAYSAVLEHLALSPTHRQNLQRRGLSEAFIRQAEYRTLRAADRPAAAKAAYAAVGEALLQVPGFMTSGSGPKLVGESTGLIIPVRDIAGRIQALKIRQDRDPKYVYLSDGGSGPSCGSPVHVPLGTPTSAEVVRVTEGELKADVCRVLDDTPTIGVPGVTIWQSALPVLQDLGAREVVVAFDAPDVRSKPPVLQQLEDFTSALETHGFEVTLEDWE